ncbi:MAG: cache domain-containing protein [Deltaproteobacteria bacterium]|nr:cache domain-containing protein [Deltaproteobacteria bacterium]
MGKLARLFHFGYGLNLQARLVAGFIIATVLTGIIATLVGIRIINDSTIAEVQRRVQQDLNASRFIYSHSLERLAAQIRFAALNTKLDEAIGVQTLHSLKTLEDLFQLVYSHQQYFEFMRIDMLAVVDGKGTVLYRVLNPKLNGDSLAHMPAVQQCLKTKRLITSTELLSLEAILRENPILRDRVAIPIVKTPQSADVKEQDLNAGLVLTVVYPIIGENQEIRGALIGGVLLNRNYYIVDKITETVYHNEIYRDRSMGYATIFLGGVRISTNVITSEGSRAVGTIVSREVYDHVIKEGKDWIDRAFVVNDWYISAYTPLYDIDKKIVGMLYTGMLEAKYRDIKRRTLWIFLGITFLGMVFAFIISVGIGNSIISRIRMLKEATEAIAAGNLDYRLSHEQFLGYGMLDEAFNNMTRSLKERDDRLQEAFMRLARTERLAALGQMAAGVAHEINNPLGGILLYSNLILEELPEGDPVRANLEKIVYQTERSKKIVENLLDFARTPSGNFESCDINEIIIKSLNLVKDQSFFFGIEIKTVFAKDLPPIRGDLSRLEEVFLNLFVNAADAMDGKGILSIATRLTSAKTVNISISDTGKGIDRTYLARIFEPFFTTKDPGKGTGLGLSIAYGIIRQHNGIIDVESEPGKGTTFKISLPPLLGVVKSPEEAGNV